MRSLLNDENSRTSMLVWGSKQKRSHSYMDNGDIDEPSVNLQVTQYGTTQQGEYNENTTNRVDSPFLIMYYVNNQYYGCFYEPSLYEIQLIEPFQHSSEDNETIATLIQQFRPHKLLCNSKIKQQINTERGLFDRLVKIETKSSKEFDYLEGSGFLDDLLNELNSKEKDKENESLKDFICFLNIHDDYKYYCCLMSILQMEFEAFNMGQSDIKNSDSIKSMKFSNVEGLMTLDLESMASLSIISLDKTDKSKMSVADLFGRCGSKIGNSMLNSYLMKPLFDIVKINQRLSAVDAIVQELEFNRKNSLISEILDSIRGLSDIGSIIKDLQTGNYKATVWKKLRNYIINIIKIKISAESSSRLMDCELFLNFCQSFSIDKANNIRIKLEQVLDFDTDIDCVNIKNDVDDEFEEFRNSYDEMEQILNNISRELSKESKCDIVTAYIPQFGYLIAIENDENDEHSKYADFDMVFQTSTTKYYKNDMMLEMDEKVGDLYSLIRDKEIEILHNLKLNIIDDLDVLIHSYNFVGHIDVMICFAKVSLENNFCKPEMIQNLQSHALELIGSFHPLLKKNEFIKNDFKINRNRLIVITGPNYSGKSTLLTQIGLSVYLAQIGCFIPATNAKMSIFKTILTRINTMDSINLTQSTFMKDCQQMSKCIYKSDNKSLVLIDEFGKGTDINDGPGLLGGVIKNYLKKENECPIVIIITHMSEIFKDNMIGTPDLIQFNHMKVIIEDSQAFKMTFLYELANGIEFSSGGLYCARKCGISIDIIKRAQYILNLIEKGKDIISEVSKLDGIELNIIKESEECIKKFLELDFQEWSDRDASKLRAKILEILK